MGKKGTARATRVKERPVFIYEIGVRQGDLIKTFVCDGTSVTVDMDNLIVFEYVDGKEVMKGQFNDWIFFYRISDAEVWGMGFEKLKQTAKPGELPEDWGKLKPPLEKEGADLKSQCAI